VSAAQAPTDTTAADWASISDVFSLLTLGTFTGPAGN
jgi:hypothetical protein